MKSYIVALALAATVIATPIMKGPPKEKEPSNTSVCSSHDTVVCKTEEKALIDLGKLFLPDLLKDECQGGDIYCCSQEDVKNVCLIEPN
jgi:hypothetical protein